MINTSSLQEQNPNPRAHFQEIIEAYPVSDWSIREVPVEVLNTCEQQRAGANERQSDLTGSIDDTGMLNAVNVAFLPRQLLDEYIGFTNRTWGANADINEFQSLPSDENYFALLIAGHSRLRAVKQTAAKRGEDTHFTSITARIHPVTSVGEIVKLQLAENIHSAPSSDRAARAIAEAFLWERASNPDLTKKDFVAAHEITRGVLNDALGYVSLPPEVRRLTDNGGLPFSIAVELGRALDPMTIAATEYASLQDENPDTVATRSEELVGLEMLRYITWFNSKGRHITHTRARIRQHANALRDKQKDRSSSEAMSMELFDAREFDDRAAYLRAEIESNLRSFQSDASARAHALHALSLEILGWEVGLQVDQKLEQDAQSIGEVALLR